MPNEVTLVRYEDGSWTPDMRQYSSIYRVETTGPTVDASGVLASSGLPSGYELYPFDSGAYVNSRVATRLDKEGKIWEVKIQYTMNAKSQPPFASGFSPQISYASEEKEEVAWSGYDATSGLVGSGMAILNSNKDPFKPPPMKPVTVLLITVKKKTYLSRATVIKGFILDYVGTLNQIHTHIHGNRYEPGTLLCRSIAPNDTGEYLEVEFVFAYKKKGWFLEILDAGTRANFTAVNFLTPAQAAIAATWDISFRSNREVRTCDVQSGINYLGKKDKPITTPVMLDGHGHLVGDIWPYDPTKPPVFIPVWINEFANWSPMHNYLT